MAVVQRAAEGGLLFRVAVAADSEVVAAEDERELLPLGRFAVDQRADVLEVAAVVELAVAAEALVALLAVADRVEDLAEDLDLLLVVFQTDDRSFRPRRWRS